MTEWEQLFPGLAWVQGMGQAQAKLAAATLRQLNAPLVEALERQRELLAGLEDAARNLAALAAQMESATKRYAELTKQTQAALEPYLRFVDWLGNAGSGGRPGVSSG